MSESPVALRERTTSSVKRVSSADRNEKGQFYKGMVGAHRSHGQTHTRFYRVFKGMQTRCNYPANAKFHRYGGRGIKCLWPDFESFVEDMYASYLSHIATHGNKNTTIDRIDVDGDYCKENCRWATWKVQQNNRSNNTLITYKGITKTVPEWSEVVGISAPMIGERIRKGWSAEKALTKKGLKQFSFNGKSQSLAAWSRDLGVNYQTLWDRVVKESWPIERAFSNQDFRL